MHLKVYKHVLTMLNKPWNVLVILLVKHLVLWYCSKFKLCKVSFLDRGNVTVLVRYLESHFTVMCWDIR